MSKPQGRFNYRRLTLRRADGLVYLDRWGVRWNGVGAVYLHKMSAPDPGMDLHDHPWPFVSVILRGGYTEIRNEIRSLLSFKHLWFSRDAGLAAPTMREWKAGSVHMIQKDIAHTIIQLSKTPTWTLVFTGRVDREWGFYETVQGGGGATQYVVAPEYDAIKRGVYVERQRNDSNG